jgi:hypothetical protein
MIVATKKHLKLGKSTIRELTTDEGGVVGGAAVVAPTLVTKFCQSAVDRCPTALICAVTRVCVTTTTRTAPTR